MFIYVDFFLWWRQIWQEFKQLSLIPPEVETGTGLVECFSQRIDSDGVNLKAAGHALPGRIPLAFRVPEVSPHFVAEVLPGFGSWVWKLIGPAYVDCQGDVELQKDKLFLLQFPRSDRVHFFLMFSVPSPLPSISIRQKDSWPEGCVWWTYRSRKKTFNPKLYCYFRDGNFSSSKESFTVNCRQKMNEMNHLPH